MCSRRCGWRPSGSRPWSSRGRSWRRRGWRRPYHRSAARRGAIVPIRCSLVGAVATSLLAPTLVSAWVLIPVLIVGMPSFGTLFTPAMTLVSEGAQHQQLDQGLAFGLGNLAWAAGQAAAASGSGALAQATSDLVPYSLLAAACMVTLVLVRIRPRSAGLSPRVHHRRRPRLHPWRV